MPKKQAKNQPKASEVYKFTSCGRDKHSTTIVCIPEDFLKEAICRFEPVEDGWVWFVKGLQQITIWGEDADKAYKLYCELNGVKP